jgi:hypothetical protein
MAMTFIDWTDPQDMFDLLVDYVGDQLGEAEEPARRGFLAGLLDRLAKMREGLCEHSALEQSHALRALQRSLDAEFSDDPVVQHIEDCAAELERVGTDCARAGGADRQ